MRKILMKYTKCKLSTIELLDAWSDGRLIQLDSGWIKTN